MEPGQIVEYIERQKIICAVVVEVRQQKLHLVNELNREVSLSQNRILNVGKQRIPPQTLRDLQVRILKETALKRDESAKKVDVRELWTLLHSEQEWISASDMADLCFAENSNGDNEAVVIRALFQNRLYFKFDQTRFFPFTEEQVEQMAAQALETDRKNRIIDQGAAWLKSIAAGDERATAEPEPEISEILKSYCLYDKESKTHPLAREILAKAGVGHPDNLLGLLIKAGVFDENENLDLFRMEIPIDFSENTLRKTDGISRCAPISPDPERRDLTGLDVMTIDGLGTRDFDDALSVEFHGDYTRLGIHIIDVGHFIARNDAIDEEALVRGSSIYMPDRKIPMLPPVLSEDLCSLKVDQVRPAISILVKLSPMANIIDYEIVPSHIRVRRQLTYEDADKMADTCPDIRGMFTIAREFRSRRLMNEAVQICLPEINLWIDEGGEIHVNRVDRENPGRLLVSEIMIMGNWLMARFLSEHDMPAVFRSQPRPKERLYKGEGGTLFQNYMQRRHLSRFKLGNKPECHSGLGVDAYVTATSPIRKYGDLVTQRQIRSIMGLEQPYNADEINYIIGLLEIPLSNVARIQFLRNRYWILKYLEKKTGESLEAMVLQKKRNAYRILLPDVMIECDLPVSGGLSLKPEDLIHVKIQHVDARKDLLALFLG